MKITEIKTFLCHAYRTNWVFVKVMTDEGIYGVGEATLEYKEHAVIAAIDELDRAIIGRNPQCIEAIVHDCYRDAYWRGGAVLMSAISGIEMALWDIKGKSLGVPVYELVGGKIRDSVPCYANGWFAGSKTPEDFAKCAKEAVKTGFDGLKWDPFGSAYMNISPQGLRSALDCVAAVRDAVGDKVHLLIEGHGRFNVPTAVRIGKALEEFGILWFEEPIPPDDKQGLAFVRSKIGVAVSGGERLYGRFEYLDFLRMECADFWQPDVSHAGGIMEVKKIAAIAEAHHIPVCPHNPSGPVANAATLQLAACVQNFYLLETMATDIPWRGEISNEKVRFENGEMFVPTSAGLGIDINEEAIARYPYQPHDLRHYKGTLTDIRPENSSGYFQK